MYDSDDSKQKNRVKKYVSQIHITQNDFDDAMNEITPTALREVTVQIPNVDWDDIGGLKITQGKIL